MTAFARLEHLCSLYNVSSGLGTVFRRAERPHRVWSGPQEIITVREGLQRWRGVAGRVLDMGTALHSLKRWRRIRGVF